MVLIVEVLSKEYEAFAIGLLESFVSVLFKQHLHHLSHQHTALFQTTSFLALFILY